MSNQKLAEMLQEIPKIAKAVNAFASEDVQRAAFDALVAAFHGETVSAAKPRKDRPPLRSARRSPSGSKSSGTKRTANKKAKGRTSAADLKNLDLRPKNKKSFRDLANEKTPTSHQEKCVLAVYYLKDTLKESAVSAGHIEACFLDGNWRLPTDLDNTLQFTSSTKKWLVTSDMNDIGLTAAGKNLVRHDLPRAAKTKK